MGPQLVQATVEDAFGAVIRFERHRADDVGSGGQTFRAEYAERRDTGHHLRTVDEGQAFFGAQHDGDQPGSLERHHARQALAAIPRFTLADQRERHVRQRREVAARTNRSLTGNHRCNAAIEQFDDKVERLDVYSRMPGRKRVGAQYAGGPHEPRVERAPIPAAWLRTRLS